MWWLLKCNIKCINVEFFLLISYYIYNVRNLRENHKCHEELVLVHVATLNAVVEDNETHSQVDLVDRKIIINIQK